MISLRDLRGQELTPALLRRSLPRAEFDVTKALEAVAPLVRDVAERGAAAVLDASERFDGVRPEHLRVPESALREALANLDPAVKSALEESISRVRKVDEAQLREDDWCEVIPGGRVGTRR
ncbi:histidinol dehydrogenase, partial [Dermabacteraceae bacterium P13101]